MKKILTLCVLLAMLGSAGAAVELEAIPHVIFASDRTFPRNASDQRISIWTSDPATARGLIKEFGLPQEEIFQLTAGQIFAIFFNDRITEDLVQITHNRATGEVFADCASSGVEYKLRAPEKGKKYSHLTAVVFTPPVLPRNLGLRGMIKDGLSEKR